ncbi:hypothetical protein AB1K32_08195 [Metabacillus dongyingensis]|uniref:hypothetical protein n=1 Tax=Metabacillus dongyingensis TaxID=2874282 RepID=UPI003B8C3DF4
MPQEKGSVQESDLLTPYGYNCVGLVADVYPSFTGEETMWRAWVSENQDSIRVITWDE